MGKLLLTGVDGNLGSEAAKILMELESKENLIFCGYNPESLEAYSKQGIETRVTNFNEPDGLVEAFKGADVLALISMPFVGVKRQNAHKNAVDAAKAAGVKQIIYTSLVNADDETNPSVEKKDHIYTEKYIKEVGLDYQFMRNSQYAEAMITNYFTYVHIIHHLLIHRAMDLWHIYHVKIVRKQLLMHFTEAASSMKKYGI
ncbi:MAG: NAD(P)H-binding protein [Lachnospiraceae bacterium]|nr:NAD(P)H-binding protein [Lachnospiraceae bacterium]